MESRASEKYNPEATKLLRMHLTEPKTKVREIFSLLTKGANPNVLSNHTNTLAQTTVIHQLLEHRRKDSLDKSRYIELIETVVSQYNANINIVNGRGNTPLQQFMNTHRSVWTQSYAYRDALRLVQLGADINVCDDYGFTLQAHFEDIRRHAPSAYDQLQAFLGADSDVEYESEPELSNSENEDSNPEKAASKLSTTAIVAKGITQDFRDIKPEPQTFNAVVTILPTASTPAQVSNTFSNGNTLESDHNRPMKSFYKK